MVAVDISDINVEFSRILSLFSRLMTSKLTLRVTWPEPHTHLDMGVRITGWLTWGYQLALGSAVSTAFDICTKNLKDLMETGEVKERSK